MDERRPNLDEQKGPKTNATPAGVNRIDMAEEGPAMARGSSPAGAEHQPAIERREPDAALGDPAEAGPADDPAVPRPDSGDTAR